MGTKVTEGVGWSHGQEQWGFVEEIEALMLCSPTKAYLFMAENK